MEKLILIDGNSLLFRSFFAMRPMVTASGVQTQGIFAFVNMLGKILNDYEHDYIAVAFDVKEKTFRHEMYNEYKAGRMKTPIELLTEIPLLHKVLDAMNIAVFTKAGYEADDIIGTIAAKASAKGIKTLVISGDKDELQLVDENTQVLINRKGMSDFDLYDVDAMSERYGLTPKQFIDLKGLMGDKSDNIPGIAGIGEKKGIALLQQYGSVEGVIAHGDEIKGKTGETVRASADIALLSKTLATIETDAPVDFTWDDIRYREPDRDRLIAIYTELEFSSFIRKLNAEEQGDTAPAVSALPDISDIKEVGYEEFLEKVSPDSVVIIEAESDFSHLDEPELTGLLLYAPDRKLYSRCEITPLTFMVAVERLLERKYRLAGYDLKPVIYVFSYSSKAEAYPYFDIMTAEYLIDPNRSKYLLDKMALRYLDVVMPEDCNDLMRLAVTAAIMDEQRAVLDSEGLSELFDKCEMPLVRTLALMEKEGICVNGEILREIGEEISSRIAVIEAEIYEEAGQKFNISSPKQLGKVLFDDMKIPYPAAKGKTGYSTAVDVLEKLRDDHEIIDRILEYRKLTKLGGTYVEGLLKLIGTDGRIRPHFNQTVAATGRLSCTEPNLQNIPVRDEYGKMIRKAFISSEGFTFVGADYSQIELRILAALSGDEGMIEDFRSGRDIHAATASRVFGIAPEDVKPADRSRAKAVNFGVIYGMSGFGLSENLNISRKDAEKYISEYFEKKPAVREFLDKQVSMGEAERKVRTLYGRVRQIPEFSSRKYMEREAAKRLAMNTPIQGTAADIIKFAMNSVSEELAKAGLRSKLILQIHDELILECPDEEVAAASKILEDCMEHAADLCVDLVAEVYTGKVWYDLK